MDEAAVEAKGLAPFQPWLDQVRGLKSRAGLADLYAQARKLQSARRSAASSARTTRHPDQYILQFFQSGLGMPDRDYYLSADPKLAETKAKYLQHLTNMLNLAGEPNAAARAKAIVDFETKIAAASWTRVESRDATKTYNKYTLAQFAKNTPGFDFREMIRASGAQGVDSLLVAQPTAIQKIAVLVGKAPLGVLKDQLLVRSLDAYAPYLPSAFDKENFAFYGTDPVGHARAGSALEARRSTSPSARSAMTSASSTSPNISRRRPRRPPTSWSTTSSARWTSGSTSSSG